MNIYEFTNYVNQDIDDTFSTEEVARWFNKAIANYNLIPPVTKYPFITLDDIASDEEPEVIDEDDTDGFISAYANYPLSLNFMLGVILPYVSSAVKSQEASVTEKQLFLQEFVANGRVFKPASNIPAKYLKDKNNTDLELYKVGEGAYLTDFNNNPFAGEWQKATAYKEVVITRKKDGTLVKYVDDSLIDEDIENG